MKKLFGIASTVFLAVFFQTSLMVAPADAQDVARNLRCGANLVFDVEGGDCEVDSGGKTAEERVDEIVSQIINILSLIVGVVAVIMIIMGGFRYVTSGGDSGSVSTAKNTILYAIVGLIIVAMAQVIVRFVVNRATLTDSSSSPAID